MVRPPGPRRQRDRGLASGGRARYSGPMEITDAPETQGEAPQGEDPFALLMACHQRIRAHCALLRQLALHPGPTEAQIEDAAQRALRYFEVALPLHAGDEDALLAPRVAADPALRAGFEALAEEHRAIERARPGVLALLRPMTRRPAARAELLEGLRSEGLAFVELLLAHIEGEERDLFPGARALIGPAEGVALARAMLARR